jgi:hypothetical protein
LLHITIRYDYSHQKPAHENKGFKPFSQGVQSLVDRHDAKVMRNSHLPDDQVERVLRKVGGVETLQKMRNQSNHTEWLANILPKLPVQISSKIPVPQDDVGQGWPENQVLVVRECLEDMSREETTHRGKHAGAFKALVHAKGVKDAIQYRLREEIGVERSLEEIDKVMRLTRLYDELQLLDAIKFSTSGEDHQLGDWIALVLLSRNLSPQHLSPQHSPMLASPLNLPTARRTLGDNGSESAFSSSDSSDSGSEDSDDDVDADTHIIKRYAVPPGNKGEIDFSGASLEDGTYEFRYYMKGSSTPACVSAPFTTCVPTAYVHVPSTPVVCGDPWMCSYNIQLTRPHHESDWLGVYQEEGTGPKGCALREVVPANNEGVVHLARSPCFPGTFYVQYHLGQHRDVVAGVSGPMKVEIKRVSNVQDTREVRLILCSTVADMLQERAALMQQVIPALQAKCESRMVTVTLVCLSLGMRGSVQAQGLVSEEETATLQDLQVQLEEIDRCSPYFVGLLGERYGWIPSTLDAHLLNTYPWLQVPRNRHLCLPGVRASALEIGILNGFLVDPHLAKHNLFFFRDQAHVQRTGVPAQKRRNFVPTSEYGREAVEMLRDQIRKIGSSNVVRYHDMQSFVSAATRQLEEAGRH